MQFSVIYANIRIHVCREIRQDSVKSVSRYMCTPKPALTHALKAILATDPYSREYLQTR